MKLEGTKHDTATQLLNKKNPTERQDNVNSIGGFTLSQVFGTIIPAFLTFGTIVGLAVHAFTFGFDRDTVYNFYPQLSYGGDNVTVTYTDTDTITNTGTSANTATADNDNTDTTTDTITTTIIPVIVNPDGKI